ncbi:MAG: FHA domain-containing protein [Rikenellaceae bacterium]
MASYRTIVPGMNESTEQPNTIYQGSNNSAQASSTTPKQGTMVPGMDSNVSQAISTPQQKSNPQLEKPLVGFLVSVSKYENGEYWVLRQGQNTIGASSECDIVLSEALVSGLHAVLAIHRNPQSDNLLSIGIMDKGSSNGVFVNEEYIGFNPYQCKNNDKIKIGNYEFLLMLFDAKVYDMKLSTSFISKDPSSEPNIENSNNFDYSSRDNYVEKNGTTQY